MKKCKGWKRKLLNYKNKTFKLNVDKYKIAFQAGDFMQAGILYITDEKKIINSQNNDWHIKLRN